MNIYFIFTLAAASFAGASMGSFMLVTLLYPALLKKPNNLNMSFFIYRRLYRLNLALCLLAGICAALIKNQSAALILTTLAASYVFTHSHILTNMLKACDEHYVVVNQRAYQAMRLLQNLSHLCQFTGALYGIYLLSQTAPLST